MNKRIELIVGGAPLGLARLVNDRVVRGVIDVKSEVDSLRQILNDSGISNPNQKYFIPVPGETLHGLLRRFVDSKHPLAMHPFVRDVLRTGRTPISRLG